jgi:transcription termination factor Rho
MSVLDRDALETSPLADLHTIAGELSIDGFRRLRKADLIERIIARQEGITEPGDANGDADELPAKADSGTAAGSSHRRRGRRGGRGRSRADDDEDASDAKVGAEPAANAPAVASEKPKKKRKAESETEPEELVEGVVELVGNGSGFVRVSPPEPSAEDVYISATQVKRCELVGGDRISGPRRPARRSERFASLIRVDTINGRPVAEIGARAHYDDLPAAFPDDRFRLGSEDPTLKAIEFLTPFGRGSRVAIVGGARAGKSRALRSLGEVLAGVDGLQLFVALAGTRPEEISDWPSDGALAPTAALSFAASGDALDHLVELVLDQARRIAARGADTVALIDGLDFLHSHGARKAMASARKFVDGGSLTVIATSSKPIGGETTVIALDPVLTAAGRFPALDLVASGTLRPELLVGDAGAQAIAEARAQALDGAG